MEIAAGGNVGIGTTSPGGKLHIRSGSSGTTANVNGKNLIVENNDAAGISVLTPDGNTPSLFLGTASDSAAVQIAGGYNSGGATEKLRLLVNNVEAMNILGSGNVGIGTTTPGAKLDVNGGVKIGSGAATIGDKVLCWVSASNKIGVCTASVTGAGTCNTCTAIS